MQLFFLSFGLYANTKRLFNTNLPKGDHLSCLDGIRFLSITWVMLGHTLSAETRNFPLSNGASFSGIFQRFEFQAVNNAFVSVDTFFLMSGCLVSYLMLKEFQDVYFGGLNGGQIQIQINRCVICMLPLLTCQKRQRNKTK